MLPAYFRFAQCLRRYRDSKEANPHLPNAGELSNLSHVLQQKHFISSLSKICIVVLCRHLLIDHICNNRKIFEVFGKSILLFMDLFCNRFLVLRLWLGHIHGLGINDNGRREQITEG